MGELMTITCIFCERSVFELKRQGDGLIVQSESRPSLGCCGDCLVTMAESFLSVGEDDA